MLRANRAKKGVTVRSVLIGFVLIPINCWWVVQSEAVWGITYLTIVSLFFNVTFTLFVLVLINLLLKRVSHQFALSQGELITIYTMLCLGSSVAGNNMLENLILSIGHASWFATPENEWNKLFFKYIPDWLAVMDKDALSGFYLGESTIYAKEHLIVWLKPLSFWSVFVFLFIFTMLCINVIIRRQWTETEKLAYPIIQLPYEITKTHTVNSSSESNSTILQNRIFWIGFLLAAALNILNGLHFHFPVIPQLRLKIQNIGHLFTNKPWNAIGWTPLAIYPWVVGIVFFIPIELSFSCWFFYIFSKFQRIIGSVAGWNTLPGFPYFRNQVAGGWLSLLFIALFMMRKHIKRVFTGIFLEDSKNEDEPISYRMAMMGMIFGIGAMVLFITVAGMSVWIALAFLLLLFAMELTVTRIRAELGPPQHEFYYVGPEYILNTALGSRRLGGNNLTMFGFLYFSDRTIGSHPMPHQLEGFKLAQRVGINSKRLAAVMLLSAAVGIIFSLWSLLHSAYKMGVSAGFLGYVGIPWESFGRLASRLQYPQGTDYPGLMFIGLGFIFSVGLMAMRMRFLWWPLHPVGYVLSSTGWIINYIWFSFLVSWLIKLVIIKYGGIKNYRKAVPFFIGLILGEYVVGCFWDILGISMGMETYGFYED